MKNFLLRYATPLTTGLFVVSLTSGIALFFHWEGGLFKGMHEWLSMVLILPFILHLWRNWRPLLAYFRHAPMAIALLVSLAAASGFAYQSLGVTSGGPPQLAFSHKIIANSPAKVAPLLGEAPEALVARLVKAGFTAATLEMALSEIATKSGQDERKLLATLVAAP